MTAPSRRLELSTRAYLLILVAALLVPIVLFAGLVLSRFADGERSRYRAAALYASERTAASVDRELAGLETALQALSTGRSFGERAYDRFYERAVEVKRIIGVDVILKDVSGQQLVNTRVPFGTPLPSSLQEHDRRAAESKEPQVSDLFVGTFFKRPTISVTVPLVRDGLVVDLLIIAVDPERLRDVLQSQALPERWTAVIVDRSGAIIARSRDHERFMGRGASDAQEVADSEKGTWLGRSAEGAPELLAFARPQLASGWRVTVGVPLAVAQAPLRHALIPLAAAGAVALLVSAAVAAWIGGRAARGMRSLARSASALGASQVIEPEPMPVREMNLVRSALIGAAQDLDRRDRERRIAEDALRLESERTAESEARLRALADNLPAGMVYQLAMERDGSRRRFVFVSQACERITGISVAAAERESTVLYSIIAPEHRASLQDAEAAALSTLQAFDLEVPFVRADTDEVRWARIVSAPR